MTDTFLDEEYLLNVRFVNSFFGVKACNLV